MGGLLLAALLAEPFLARRNPPAAAPARPPAAGAAFLSFLLEPSTQEFIGAFGTEVTVVNRSGALLREQDGLLYAKLARRLQPDRRIDLDARRRVSH